MSELKSKTKKKHNCCIVAIILLVVLASSVLGFYLNIKINYNSNNYTEKEHLQRIDERIKSKYMNESFPFTDYEIYPLYTENDEFRYALVEFEDEGFVYVLVHPGKPISVWLMGMYFLSAEDYNDDPWRRYTIELGTEATLPDKNGNLYTYRNRKWEQDSEGNYIDYYNSPYKVAGIVDEKRYLLEVEQPDGFSGLIPAVKRGDKYLNLISMNEIEYVPISQEITFAKQDRVNFEIKNKLRKQEK